MQLPFNRPHLTGKELQYVTEAVERSHLSGDGLFTKRTNEWLARYVGSKSALLTHSCTAALEMAALLASIEPGDEIIMPSYTFVSTANAFVLRGGVPVFVDIRKDTLNLDETLIEGAITTKTRAIVPVHYAGVACEMDTILEIARRHNLFVIEDAAQAIGSRYKGRRLGSLGHLGALSFHETKNIISGEGGALLVNDDEFVERAEIIREKGTNRSNFLRGVVDKYTWVDVGSSYLPSEIIAAFLWAQIEHIDDLMAHRLSLWNEYHRLLEPLEATGALRRPTIPQNCEHNAHLYYVLLKTPEDRDRALQRLREKGIGALFHYIPLHSAVAGQRFARTYGDLCVTDDLNARLVRLPLFQAMTGDDVATVVDALSEAAA